jgi:hypothetical protein
MDFGTNLPIILKIEEKIDPSSSTDVSKKTTSPIITPAKKTSVEPIGEITSETFTNSEKPIRPVLPRADMDRTKIRNPSDTFGRAKKNFSLIKRSPKNMKIKGIRNDAAPKKRIRAAFKKERVGPDCVNERNSKAPKRS